MITSLPYFFKPQATQAVPSVQFGWGFKKNKTATKNDTPTQEPSKFYEARPKRLAVGSVKQLARFLSNSILNLEINISEADKKRLKAYDESKIATLLTPNHSSAVDLPAIVEVARQAGITPTYLGAKEVFFEPRLGGKKRPFIGKLSQWIGINSVDREASDKSATVNAASRGLTSKNNILVLFPEAHVTNSNLTVDLPKSGSAKIALNVIQEGKATQIVPIAFYYHHRKPILPHILKLTEKLEQKLLKNGAIKTNISPAKLSPEARMTQVFDWMVASREKDYGSLYEVEPLLFPNPDPYQRLANLRQVLLHHLEGRYLPKSAEGNLNQPENSPAENLSNTEAPASLEQFSENSRAHYLLGQIKAERKKELKIKAHLNTILDTSDGIKPIQQKVEELDQKESDPSLKQRLSEWGSRVYDELLLEFDKTSYDLKQLNQDIKTVEDLIHLTNYPKDMLLPNSRNNHARSTRLLEMLGKLERDIYGGNIAHSSALRYIRILRKADIEVRVKVCEPIDIKTMLEQALKQTALQKIEPTQANPNHKPSLSSESEKQLVQSIGQEIRSRIQNAITQMAADSSL